MSRAKETRGGARPASRPPRPRSEAAQARRRFRVGVRLTIVGLVIALVVVGLGHVRRYVDALPRHQVLPAEVGALTDGAPWLSREDLLAIRRDATIGRRLGIFHPALEATVSEAWARSPMVRRVRSVQKIYPNRVRLDLEIRRPVAAVPESGGGLVLVDRDGVRWPGRFDRVPARFGDRVLALAGVSSAAPPPGEGWDDRRVREGVAVAVDLARSMSDALRKRAAIVAIDVSNVGAREPHASEIVLRTAGGREIRWGRSSASPHGAGELSVARKLEHVARALELYPDFENVAYIGVFANRLFVRVE